MEQGNKLIGKIIIKGQIEILSGLRIGAGKEDVDLGSPELPIVKTYDGQPFIPGSSLKGKMRSLLAKCTGSFSVDDDVVIIKELFGDSGANDSDDENRKPTLLLFRDAYPTHKIQTESKYENTIVRTTGAAINPRQLERVPMGSIFLFEIVYNLYDVTKAQNHLKVLDFARLLLNEDYLGGSGSRGYGKVNMTFTNIEKKIFSADNWIFSTSVPIESINTYLENLPEINDASNSN